MDRETFFLSSNSTEHGAINNFELLDLRLVLARRAAHLIDTKKVHLVVIFELVAQTNHTRNQ